MRVQSDRDGLPIINIVQGNTRIVPTHGQPARGRITMQFEGFLTMRDTNAIYERWLATKIDVV